MRNLKYKGKLQQYLLMPTYFIFILAIIDMICFAKYPEVAPGITGASVFFGVVIMGFFHIYKKQFEEEVDNYARHSGTVQRAVIESFQCPYAMLDQAGTVLWMNDGFANVVGKDKKNFRESISSIFPEISKETLKSIRDNKGEIYIDHKERKYKVTIQVFHPEMTNENDEIRDEIDGRQNVFTLLLEDVTEYLRMKQETTDRNMVMALIYIDNYEELFNNLDETKKRMIAVLLESRISKYFKSYNAILHRQEKDKFFCVFQNKYLEAMKADNFSLLEEVKALKIAGNTVEATISIGIGCNSTNYNTVAQLAQNAIDMALARGGSQAVIKDEQNVEYFGSGGKEIEKNNRVRSRVKASALKDLMQNKENILVMGHIHPDADCLGAATAVCCMAKELDKPINIVINERSSSLKSLIECLETSEGYTPDTFVDSSKARDLCNDNTLVIVVDTNRSTMVDCPDLLRMSHSVVVFDHHRRGEDVIKNSTLSYVEPSASSASEMMAEVLQYFSDKPVITPEQADIIYAGIYIDTNSFMAKAGVRTFEAAAFLRRNGADVTRVRKVLRENMDSYKAKAEVVRNAFVYKNAFAISIFNPGNVENPNIIGAKAANELLNILGIRASFVITETEKVIYISARSFDDISVHRIMEVEPFNGGGHMNIAAAQVNPEELSASEVKENICRIIDEMIEKGDIKL